VYALIVDFVLGFLVLLTNAKRTTNQHFFTLSFVIALWLMSLAFSLMASGMEEIEFWIRLSHVSGAFILPAFNVLRLSITHKEYRWGECVRLSGLWILIAVGVGFVCQTSFFLQEVVSIPESSLAEPVYGFGNLIYGTYFLSAVMVLFLRIARDARASSGMVRTELQFVVLGTILSLLLGSFLGLVLPYATGRSYSVQFMPLSVLVLDVVIAYGIATRRLLGVADVLRWSTAYALLCSYLFALYIGVWWAADACASRLPVGDFPLAHLLAALSIAFSMAPAHGWMQRFANRLFVNVGHVDVRAALQKGNRILQSIATLDDLLKRFSESLSEVMGTDRVLVLLLDGPRYIERYPLAQDTAPAEIKGDDAVVKALKRVGSPLVLDAIRRMRPSVERAALSKRLAGLKVDVAVAVGLKRKLDGIMLLGPRLSGRIYGRTEQEALQTLCNQLAVAVENAKLFTELQDSKIYGETLVDNLVGGVVAANVNQTITVFNREAQRIIGTDAASVLGQQIDVLPKPLEDIMKKTFADERGVMNKEVSVAIGSRSIPLHIGSSSFRGHTGESLGALLVFNDLTAIKQLEGQLRRSDRLASLGTLSAGMAHEIKNPLVTIKTFTQLLPERYQDSDFRRSFLTLVGGEVKRIDGLVNQLLQFARPSTPVLLPVHIHELLDKSLRLVEQQLHRRNVTAVRNFDADDDVIRGDAALLGQAFVNFLLNSLDAMDGGGELRVSTQIARTNKRATRRDDSRDAGAGLLRIAMQDTGEGISGEDLPRIFDPFFSTKVNGTGLGLAVSHGIVTDQGGVIDVRSREGIGTTFLLEFPLMGEQATV